MNDKMNSRLQQILDCTREPVNNQSVAELGLVQRIRYDRAGRRLIVFFHAPRYQRICCAMINGMVLHSTKKILAENLRKEFPDLAVEFS